MPAFVRLRGTAGPRDTERAEGKSPFGFSEVHSCAAVLSHIGTNLCAVVLIGRSRGVARSRAGAEGFQLLAAACLLIIRCFH